MLVRFKSKEFESMIRANAKAGKTRLQSYLDTVEQLELRLTELKLFFRNEKQTALVRV